MTVNFNFSGTYPYALDDKGRLMLPSPLRDELRKSEHPDKMVISYYPGTNYLSLYPVERWRIQSEKWQEEARFASSKLMSVGQRLFFSNIDNVTLDKTGRILVSSTFRDKIGLQREAVVLGISQKLELWAPDRLKVQEAEDLKLWEKAVAEEGATNDSGDLVRLPQW